MTQRDYSFAFVIGGFPLLSGPVLRGLTACFRLSIINSEILLITRISSEARRCHLPGWVKFPLIEVEPNHQREASPHAGKGPIGPMDVSTLSTTGLISGPHAASYHPSSSFASQQPQPRHQPRQPQQPHHHYESSLITGPLLPPSASPLDTIIPPQAGQSGWLVDPFVFLFVHLFGAPLIIWFFVSLT